MMVNAAACTLPARLGSSRLYYGNECLVLHQGHHGSDCLFALQGIVALRSIQQQRHVATDAESSVLMLLQGQLCNACACTTRAAQRLAACLKLCALLLYVAGRATALRCCQSVCSAFFCSTDAQFHLGRPAGWHFMVCSLRMYSLQPFSLQSWSQSYSGANACRVLVPAPSLLMHRHLLSA